MYKEDVSKINDLCRENHYYYNRMLVFVILSIRTKFSRLHTQMEDYYKYGYKASCVWGFKYKALSDLPELRSYRCTEEYMDYLKKHTGFGNAKAGFVCQMMGHNVACLDTHNLEKLGIKDVRTMSTKAYIELTQQTGGAEYWWDSWCEHIAQLYPTSFSSADEVSKYHLNCIKGA